MHNRRCGELSVCKKEKEKEKQKERKVKIYSLSFIAM